jgi:hypothetical protein
MFFYAQAQNSRYPLSMKTDCPESRSEAGRDQKIFLSRRDSNVDFLLSNLEPGDCSDGATNIYMCVQSR